MNSRERARNDRALSSAIDDDDDDDALSHGLDFPQFPTIFHNFPRLSTIIHHQTPFIQSFVPFHRRAHSSTPSRFASFVRWIYA